MNKEEYKDYLKLSGKITEKLDNTATYENWLIIQEYIDRAQQKVEQLEKENDKLKHKLNDIAFGDDSELALRFLRRIGYVGFDEKRKVYINKHNNEPFLWKDEQEKDYYLKDEELNEYTQQLEYKVEQLENIRKEATEFMKENCDIITTYKGWIIRSELTTTGLGKLFKILNKGSNKNE